MKERKKDPAFQWQPHPTEPDAQILSLAKVKEAKESGLTTSELGVDECCQIEIVDGQRVIVKRPPPSRAEQIAANMGGTLKRD